MVTFYQAPKRTNNAPKQLKSLDTDGYDHQLRAVSMYQHKPLFITGAMSGETINARVYRQTSKKGEAVATSIVHSHSERIEPRCLHFLNCGGCQLQMMPSDYQRSGKAHHLKDQLSHQLKITIEPSIIHGENYGYRRRARLQVNAQYQLHFMAIDGKQAAAITECPVLVPALEALIKPVNQWLLTHKPKVTHVELISDDTTVGLVVRHTQPVHLGVRQCLADALGGPSIWFKASTGSALTDIQGNRVDPELQYRLEHDHRAVTLNFRPHHFVQSNPQVNQAMVNNALSWLALSADDRVLDLYAGMGNFTLALSQHCHEVVAVEVSHEMVIQGKRNAASNGCENVRWHTADLSEPNSLDRWSSHVDAVLMDPPRAGAPEVVKQIVSILPGRVLSVSCNPATFVRDAKPLLAAGYQLTKIALIDMFAQTAHSEVMGLFERKTKHNKN
ncbi:methyltransferase domain-containing protein [bacterium]|nr:methyltransferase domain-containing protein [bacterium]